MQNPKLIISITSYPARINAVHKTVKSLLDQSHKADKLILWLGDDKFPNKEADLPQELRELQKNGLTISWCKDIKSYTKLIPTLAEYPNDIIVTADDDIIYPKEWLDKLYQAYLKEPNMVHCHRAHKIRFINGKIIPYNRWKFAASNVKPSFRNFLTGVGGVLYPPHLLYKDILREELFLNLTPSNDDVWFWAMCVLNDIKINVIKHNHTSLDYVPDSQNVGLWYTNLLQNANDECLKKVFAYYPQLLKKINRSPARYASYLKWIFSVHKEKSHKIIQIFGFKIKLRRS